MKRTLCLWLPNWPIQRLLVARPELSGQAVVLHARDARRGQRVVYCSDVARACGVRPHMPLAEAAALSDKAADAAETVAGSREAATKGRTDWQSVQDGLPIRPTTKRTGLSQNAQGDLRSAVVARSGDRPQRDAGDRPQRGVEDGLPIRPATLYLQEHDAQADREALEQLAVWCQRFSPVVGLETADEPACLLLDVTGLELLFGDEQTLLREVLQTFRKRGYTVRLAIADTVAAAWAVAHFGEDDPMLIVSTGKNIAALSPLPIEALRLPEKTAELLRQLGICHIEQLARLPRTALSSRFGDQLLQRWNQATGALHEVIVAHRPPAPLEAQWTLEHPTTRRDVIDSVLQRLIEQLAELLARRNRGVIQLTCRLDCLDAQAAHVQVGLFRPTAKAEHLRQLLGMQLDQLTLPGPLHRILVQAAITAPLEDRQGELLDGAARDSSRHLAKLVDRLSSRLGRDRVVGAQLLSEAQVERAYRDVPLTGQRPSPPASTAASLRRHTAAAGQRPLHLHPSPMPLDVIAVVPDGPPVSFVWQNQRHDIRQHWGPERIETGWWRGRSVRSDYYRVEDQHGSRFWLFRRMDGGRWFLQGEFE